MSFRLKNLKPFDLHQRLMNEYRSSWKESSDEVKTDFDVVRENHKFLWSDEDEKSLDRWEKRLAKKYYDKLYKEYCIADLTKYKENKFGLRWRTEDELIDGKGQFTCGNRKCHVERKLRTWEVNFGYVEEGEKKNVLVKLRLCPRCSYKLNYTHKRKEVIRQKNMGMDAEEGTSAQATACEKEGGNGDGLKNEASGETSQPDEKDDPGNVWKKKTEKEKTIDEKFDDYLQKLIV